MRISDPTYPSNDVDGNAWVPYNVDRINIHNWDGGNWYRPRHSKKSVWAIRMFFPEGFTFKSDGKKVIGKYGEWFVLDGEEKYLLTNRMFKKTYYYINNL